MRKVLRKLTLEDYYLTKRGRSFSTISNYEQEVKSKENLHNDYSMNITKINKQ